MIDFDAIIERRNTASLKWSHYGDDVLPLWVADMDFKAPPCVMKALQQRVDHGVFGYSLASDDLVDAILNYFKQTYQAVIDPSWLVWLPGLVPGFNIAARAFGAPGGSVLTSTPIYPPFLCCGENNGHTTVSVPLVNAKTRWELDFDVLKTAITPRTYMWLLCSPHNPTGRIWERSELEQIAELCCQHDLIMCSDEIHCDLLLDESKPHIPTFLLSDDIAQRTITLMAPSKTYNIAGLNCSFAVIPNKELRKKYIQAMQGLIPHVNVLGNTAAAVAYREGADWLKKLRRYLRSNHAYVREAINSTPGLHMHPVEATYLAWIDVRELAMDDPYTFFLDQGVAMSDGKAFGQPGFLRLNFGCPKAMLEQAMARITKSVRDDNITTDM